MARIAGQNMAADMSAYGSILEGPIPEMAVQEYIPPAPQMSGLNMALTIGQGIMSGIKTYGMAGGDFGGAASETSTPDDAGPNS